MSETASAAEESRPSADMEAVRLLSVAFVKTIGRRKAIRFVDELAAVVETELRVRKLMPARAREALAPQHAAQQEGAAMVQRLIPVLVAAIPRE